MTAATLADAVSTFGAATKAKLTNAGISGSPEDQLRGPLETFIRALATLAGLPPTATQLVGETSLSEIKTRPDYAVTIRQALVGFVEVKAPGKGADPAQFSDPHDKDQFAKLKSLPNLIYTDGNGFSLWQDGKRVGKTVHLDGDVASSGAKLAAPPQLLTLFSDFFSWTPITPKTPKGLAEVAARLCRLLREEVADEMGRGNESLTSLAGDWRKYLFPDASDAQFADGYAQAVTFGLLLAKSRGISLKDGVDHAALELRKTNSLIGSALRLLTDDANNQKALETSLSTLTRVLEAVDWATVTKGSPDAWLYFYENFLEVYDKKLRKQTGSYYTPPEVVEAMVRLVDETLRGKLFGRAAGLASGDVTVADPAVGTGTFLLGVMRKIAATVGEDQGEGAVRGAVLAAAKRLVGFELQFGPFAVAQLRLIAEMQALMHGAKGTLPEPRLFITDTLGNPYFEEEVMALGGEIAKSRQAANTIKKGEPITVVIGNPPYKEKAKGRGGWIESGTPGLEKPMDRWRPPPEWGVGAHTKHLKNLYVYFWRWATWKVFGTGVAASTRQAKDGAAEQDKDEEGIVCFITVAGFLNGPGFQKMRDDLRRTCSEIWVIDCSPDGHQPEVAMRIFQGVQQPVCIVLAARKLGKDRETPAQVQFLSLPKGKREAKFAALEALSLASGDWAVCPTGFREPFLPEATGAWASFPRLSDLFDYGGSGVLPGRGWAISPDQESLHCRWEKLLNEKDAVKKEVLFRPQYRNEKVAGRHIRKIVKEGLGLLPARLTKIIDENGPLPNPVRYAFRSFDRQWLIGDARLLNDVRPILWNANSGGQIFATTVSATSPLNGPALTFTGNLPDQDHYSGRGGRVFPLWANAAATVPNIKPDLLALLSLTYGSEVSPEDVMAYLAAVMAHPAFTARFKDDLIRPGLRVPLTADAALFAEAAALGREVIWMHTYGERFDDAAAGRPKGPPRLPKASAPRIPAAGEIPGAPEPLPDTMSYDPAGRRLTVGKGFIDHVSPEMWAYEVSGKQVVWQWFSYRKRDRSKPLIGDKRPPSPLDAIQPDHWPAEYTSDLIDLLNVLGRLVALEPAQADLLTRLCEGPLLGTAELPGIAGTSGGDLNEPESSPDA